MSYNTNVYMEQGGDRLVVASGGKISVESGGVIDLETGAQMSGPVSGPMTATFVVGTEAANVINVAIQLKDAEGNDLATPSAIPWYLADDAAGLVPATVAPTVGTSIGTDGSLIEWTANLSGMVISEADGDIDIDIEDAGTPTLYLVLVNPFGQLLISAAITFT